MNKTVYISSTSEDLEDERKAAFEAARGAGLEPIGMEYYGAAGRPPLAKCLEDARSCDFYIGILAWRYGSLPPGQTKSFTQLEYEAAGKAGAERFLFLSADHDAWPADLRDADPAAIRSFRERVSADNLCAGFKDPASLNQQILIAFAQHFQGRRRRRRRGGVPPLLPYYCDRLPQLDELRGPLSAHAAAGRGRPLVCMVHGDRGQAHSEFVDCVSSRYLAELMGRDADEVTVRAVDVPWSPGATDPAAAFRRRVGCEVLRDGSLVSVSEADLRDALLAVSGDGPTLVRVQFPVRNWREDERRGLEDVTRFWLGREWPELVHPLVLVFFFEYPTAGDGLLVRLLPSGRRRAGVEQALERLPGRVHPGPGYTLLPELGDVQLELARHWARNEAPGLIGRVPLEAEVNAAYGGATELPMEQLAGKLREILEDKLKNMEADHG
ncbi:MAG: DUF4062 domain-containing protein [Planctomycetota bacterium]